MQQAESVVHTLARPCRSDRVKVCLRVGDDICKLRAPSLDRLQAVTCKRKLQQHERVGHPGDLDLGLADAHRLDNHDVEPGGLAQLDGFRSASRHAAAGARGGVTACTPEAIELCEAAGFDVVIVETVGVGQAEIEVAGMTDAFVLLELPFAGDSLQAIKRGSTELADVIAYAKADLDAVAAAGACERMNDALSLLRPVSSAWRPRVVTVSCLLY